MNRRFRRFNRLAFTLWSFIFLLAFCLAVRLVWCAAGTETGIQTLRLHWRDATLGWVLGSYEPVHSRQPSEQAAYWLREVDRVLGARPKDARLTMGAAMVLDSPAQGFLWRHLNNLPGFGLVPERDAERIKHGEDVFENECKRRCLELASEAVRLDPTEVQWWRLYALLQFRQGLYSDDKAPRDPDWVNTLNECARHDPDNALYDYLAARFYWETAAMIDWSANNGRLVIQDPDRFRNGIVRFEEGQKKPYFSLGDKGYSAVADFLSHTRVPLTDHVPIVNSRNISIRHCMLLKGLTRWQDARADEKMSAGDVITASALLRESLNLIDQYESLATSAGYDEARAFRVAITWKMKAISDAYGDTIDASEREQVAALYEAALMQRQIVNRAAQGLVKGAKPALAGLASTADAATVARALIVSTVPSLVTLLLIVVFLAVILSRWFGGSDLPRVGPIAQLFTLLAATATTVVLFGLAPAEIISPGFQSWFFTGALVLTPVTVAGAIGWRWLRGHAFQFSIRSMLIATMALALLLGLIAAFRPDAGAFASFPFRLSVPASGWHGLDAAAFRVFSASKTWLWAGLQWIAYGGPFLTLALWGGLLAAQYGLRIRASLGLRERLGGLLRVLGHSAFLMATVLLMTYLFSAPSIVTQTEREFQAKMAFARDPQGYWTEVEKAVQRVRSDVQTMDELKEWVRQEAAQPANLGVEK